MNQRNFFVTKASLNPVSDAHVSGMFKFARKTKISYNNIRYKIFQTKFERIFITKHFRMSRVNVPWGLLGGYLEGKGSARAFLNLTFPSHFSPTMAPENPILYY